MRHFLQPFIVVAAALSAISCANAAPQQLYNKSVTVNWNESVMQLDQSGTRHNPQIASNRVIYISSAGRLFVKGTRSINNRFYQGSKTVMRGPDGSNSANLGGFSFAGNELVGTAVFNGGARRVTVSFNGSFSSCTANVVYGKSGSANQKWPGMDGITTYEVLSISVGAVSCSISEGNAVAG